MDKILDIRNLYVNVGEKEILQGVNLVVNKGETHVIMGPNGAGKSTLGCAIMGSPNYEIVEGRIYYKDEDITEDEPEKKAKAGIFLTFQNPIEIPGITLSNFIKTAVDARSDTKSRLMPFRKELEKKMDILNMDRSYANRDLNVGFSGGEKKKAEILQMLMIKPDLAILDETDSGLDIDAVKTVSDGVKDYHENSDGALIIITHSTRILESLDVDKVHVLVDGKIVDSGDSKLIDKINNDGFEKYLKQA